MQLMPLYDVLAQNDSGSLLGSEAQSSQSAKGIFATVLDRHSELARKEEQGGLSAVSAKARSAFGGRTSTDDTADTTGADAKSAFEKLEAAVARLKGDEADSAASRHDLKVTSEDFKSISKALKEFGMSDEDIESLGEQVASEGGLTWGRLVSAISTKAAELSKIVSTSELALDEEGKLMSLFQKMGFTFQDAETLLSDFKAGRMELAWSKLNEKLKAMSEDETLNLSADELDALATVMGLRTEVADTLKSLLADADSVRVTKAKLESVLAVARQAAGDDANERLQRMVELRDAVKAVFEKATDGAEDSERSANGPDDTARRNRILSEHSRRQEKAEKSEPKPGENVALAENAEEGGTEASKVLRNESAKTAAAAAKAAAAAAESGKAEGKGETVAKAADSRGETAAKAAGSGARAEAAEARAEAAQAKAESHGRTAAEAGKSAAASQQAGDDAGADAKDAKADANSQAWDKFWNKVSREDFHASGKDAGSEVGADAAAAKATAAATEVTVPFPTDGATAEAAADKAVQRVLDGNSERILRQVEQGVLKNVRQGAKQLTLRLTPPDLGRVHLQIQVKEGEVRVLLRAENVDAGKMISENLTQMRQSLESQGLKVDKLEVQTQLADNQFKDSDWQGAQEHNEMLQRHREMARMSRWRSINSQGMELAREMQNIHDQARISSQGIDIIA